MNHLVLHLYLSDSLSYVCSLLVLSRLSETVYVGIDIHKHYCQAAIMNNNGQVLKELRFDNTSKGASTLLDLARSLDPHVKAVVEPSANYWIRIYDKLEKEGVEVKLSNPLRTKP